MQNQTKTYNVKYVFNQKEKARVTIMASSVKSAIQKVKFSCDLAGVELNCIREVKPV